MNYRREIDGLRAVAVVPVILFHAGFAKFGGGYVGVDVFFVISGYLITSIIFSEQEAGTFSLVRFYERRARRILPALCFVMAASIPFAWLWLSPTDLKAFSDSAVAVALFASNILFWRESGYFDTAAELKPLLHTWSLAVEEQYYVLFPLFMILAWRLGRRWLVALIAAGAVLSLALAHWGAYHRPAATFFLLPMRAWELAIGALIAIYLARRERTTFAPALAQTAGVLGVALICYSVVAFNRNTPFPSLYALVPTLGTALVILFATPTTVVGRILGARVFVGIGLASYSAYLWHQPLFAFARHRSGTELGTGLLLSLVAATLVLAYFSWRFVEVPFRQKARITRRTVFAFAASASLVFVALGTAGHRTGGFEEYYVNYRVPQDSQALYRLVRQHTGKDLYKSMFDDGDCRFWARGIDRAFESRFRQCSERYGKALIILGDSHAMNVYNIFAKAGMRRFTVGLSQGGCQAGTDRADCYYSDFDRFVADNGNAFETVFFHQSGSYLLRDKYGRLESQLAFEDDAVFSIDRAGIDKIRTYLNRLGTVTDTVWLGPFVEARVDFGNLSQVLFVSEKSLSHFRELEAELKRVAAAPGARFRYVSLHDLLAIDRNFLRIGSCITYNDTNHFSGCGEDLLAPKVAAAYNAGAFGRKLR